MSTNDGKQTRRTQRRQQPQSLSLCIIAQCSQLGSSVCLSVATTRCHGAHIQCARSSSQYIYKRAKSTFFSVVLLAFLLYSLTQCFLYEPPSEAVTRMTRFYSELRYLFIALSLSLSLSPLSHSYCIYWTWRQLQFVCLLFVFFFSPCRASNELLFESFVIPFLILFSRVCVCVFFAFLFDCQWWCRVYVNN